MSEPEQEPQRALAWAQRIINSSYTDQNIRELVVYLMQTLEQTGEEERRLREVLEEIERWPGNYGENASACARHALERKSVLAEGGEK